MPRGDVVVALMVGPAGKRNPTAVVVLVDVGGPVLVRRLVDDTRRPDSKRNRTARAGRLLRQTTPRRRRDFRPRIRDYVRPLLKNWMCRPKSQLAVSSSACACANAIWYVYEER